MPWPRKERDLGQLTLLLKPWTLLVTGSVIKDCVIEDQSTV